MTNRGSISKRIRRRIGTTLQRSVRSAEAAAQQVAQKTAQKTVQSAKQSLDQILLGLGHKKLEAFDPQDLIQRVGRSVLHRAEQMRLQIADTPFSPTWLKEVTLVKPEPAKQPSTNSASTPAPSRAADPEQQSLSFEADEDSEKPVGDATGSITESSRSLAAEEMQPESHREAEAHAASSSKGASKKAAQARPVKAAKAPRKGTAQGSLKSASTSTSKGKADSKGKAASKSSRPGQ